VCGCAPGTGSDACRRSPRVLWRRTASAAARAASGSPRYPALSTASRRRAGTGTGSPSGSRGPRCRRRRSARCAFAVPAGCCRGDHQHRPPRDPRQQVGNDRVLQYGTTRRTRRPGTRSREGRQPGHPGSGGRVPLGQDRRRGEVGRHVVAAPPQMDWSSPCCRRLLLVEALEGAVVAFVSAARVALEGQRSSAGQLAGQLGGGDRPTRPMLCRTWRSRPGSSAIARPAGLARSRDGAELHVDPPRTGFLAFHTPTAHWRMRQRFGHRSRSVASAMLRPGFGPAGLLDWETWPDLAKSLPKQKKILSSALKLIWVCPTRAAGQTSRQDHGQKQRR